MHIQRDVESRMLIFSRGSNLPTYKVHLFGLVLVAAMTVLCCLPFIHAVFWLGDEGILLHGAIELASGKKLYTDFWEFYPPAGFLITEGWIEVFGQSIVVVRSLAILTITGIACFTYLTCVLVTGDVIFSVILIMFWIVHASQNFWVIVIHHWLTTFLSIVTAWAAMKNIQKNDERVEFGMVAGLTAGAAAMVTSSRGLFAIFAALATFTDFKRFRKQFLASLFSCLIVPLICLAYIIVNGEFFPAYNDIVRFTLSGYSTIQAVPFGDHEPWRNKTKEFFPLCGALSLLTIIIFRIKVLRDPIFRSCLFFGFAGLLGVFPRPDIVHINYALPLALPLVAYCVCALTSRWYKTFRVAILIAVALSLGRPGMQFLHGAMAAINAPTFQTNAGPISLLGTEKNGGEKTIRFIMNQPAGDKFLFYPYLPMMPYLTHSEDVSEVDLTSPDYTSPNQYFDICTAASKKAKWIVIDTVWADPNHWKVIFPAIKNSDPPETRAFNMVVSKDFQFVAQFGEFQIRKRSVQTNADDCQTILSKLADGETTK